MFKNFCVLCIAIPLLWSCVQPIKVSFADSPSLALALKLRPALPLYSPGWNGVPVPFLLFLVSLGLSLEVRF